jgi:hypothetical protein
MEPAHSGSKHVSDQPTGRSCLGGGPVRVCLRGAGSGGQLALVDEVIPPGYGPPLHVHPNFAEGFTCRTVRSPFSWVSS